MTKYSEVIDIKKQIFMIYRVEFPKNRFDIYKGHNVVDPTLIESMRRQGVPEQIPHELKLLIRMLLSTDPEKRPSCQEILAQLEQIPQPLYMDDSSLFGGPTTNTSTAPGTDGLVNGNGGSSNGNGSSLGDSNGNNTSSASTKMKKGSGRRPSWRTQDGYFSPGIIKNEPSMLDIGSKIQAITPDEEEVRMDRGGIYHEGRKDNIMDSWMEEKEQDDVMEEEKDAGSSSRATKTKRENSHESVGSKRRKMSTDYISSENELLIGSSDNPEIPVPATTFDGFRSDLIGIRTVKMVTALLKVNNNN